MKWKRYLAIRVTAHTLSSLFSLSVLPSSSLSQSYPKIVQINILYFQTFDDDFYTHPEWAKRFLLWRLIMRIMLQCWFIVPVKSHESSKTFHSTYIFFSPITMKVGICEYRMNLFGLTSTIWVIQFSKNSKIKKYLQFKKNLNKKILKSIYWIYRIFAYS